MACRQQRVLACRKDYLLSLSTNLFAKLCFSQQLKEKMNRNQALEILDELKNSPNMKNHGLAVGFTMAALYDYFEGEDKDPEGSRQDWEIAGILHDADYEITNKSLELHTDETTKKLQAI